MKSGKNSQQKENVGSLSAQIRETERQITARRHCVHVHADTLIKDLQHEMTLPTTLLLASQFGFIVGELTKSPPKKDRTAKRDAEAREDTGATPLKKAVNFMSLANALFQALPLVWIMDTFYPAEDASKKGTASKVQQRQH